MVKVVWNCRRFLRSQQQFLSVWDQRENRKARQFLIAIKKLKIQKVITSVHQLDLKGYKNVSIKFLTGAKFLVYNLFTEQQNKKHTSYGETTRPSLHTEIKMFFLYFNFFFRFVTSAITQLIAWTCKIFSCQLYKFILKVWVCSQYDSTMKVFFFYS